jgi:hypothetical protein
MVVKIQPMQKEVVSLELSKERFSMSEVSKMIRDSAPIATAFQVMSAIGILQENAPEIRKELRDNGIWTCVPNGPAAGWQYFGLHKVYFSETAIGAMAAGLPVKMHTENHDNHKTYYLYGDDSKGRAPVVLIAQASIPAEFREEQRK